MTDIRIGYGYDVHRLESGRRLVLGGVEIPFSQGLAGHSDADILLHAIVDAMLGALSLGDIGAHFPDSDPAYRNISSLNLLERVREIAAKNGYIVGNIDSVIILESPKIAPFVERMRKNIAEAVQIGAERVSVKATTSEGMGFAGSGEGAAAHAVVLMNRR